MKTWTRWACALIGAGVALVAWPQTARAEYPEHGVHVGAYGGGVLKLHDWDLGEAARNGTVQPKSAPDVGLRLGYHILPQLIGEIGGGYLPLTSTNGGSNTGFKYDFDLYYHLMPTDVSPFIGIGTGAFLTTSGGDLGGDNDIQAHASLGVRGLITPHIALRAEARDYIVDSYSTLGGNNLELTAGIDFYLFGAQKAAPAPSDRDKDGIADADDKCPDTPGTAALQGCPDSDGDGIADAADKCPTEPGDAAHEGCPVRDQDGDTIPDDQDKCPTVAGTAAFDGCPDTDKDGIPDASDRCPQQPGPKELQGCPDRDGDKVADIDDKCPDKAGLPDYQGCVPDAVAKFTGAIKGINFQTGSATILPASYTVLDQAVSVLKEYKTLRIRIDGHTDNQGAADRNQKLSEDRAASVKAYLVSKGVDASRIETAGYGDTRPVEDNATAKGRAANRRIEFSVLGQ